ncbi:MAG: F0F1 ATP synthase subunit B [Pseudomonadota bacterium]
MLESDSFWALVGLILFLILIFAIGAPGKVLKAIDRRTERIRAELDEAKKAREEAQALLAEYQRRRRDAEAEAETIVEEAKREAQRMTEEANAKLRDMVDRRTESAEAKITQAETQALKEVRSRAADLAVAAAADILKTKLQGENGVSMVDTSIDAVRAKLN